MNRQKKIEEIPKSNFFTILFLLDKPYTNNMF